MQFGRLKKQAEDAIAAGKTGTSTPRNSKVIDMGT